MQKFPSEILEKIRVQLEDEKNELQKKVEVLTAQDPFSDPTRLNDNAATDTEASEESNHDRYQAMVDELNQKLGEIDNALIRIGNGAYGYCSNCGQMIDTDRLSILPMATLCLDCESKKTKPLS
jgi:RNA polymerase-binding protein DksA